MSEDGKRHIVVIGGGIVGVCVAEALLRDGQRVTLLEPGDFGGEHQASYGNGAFISPASIIPMSMPGLWAKVPGYLLDRRGALTIRWPYLPRLTGWLLRFLAAGWSEARVSRTTAALADLLQGAPQLHREIAGRIGAPEMIHDDGLLYLYENRAAFEAEGLALKLRRAHGVQMTEYEGAALARTGSGAGTALYVCGDADRRTQLCQPRPICCGDCRLVSGQWRDPYPRCGRGTAV